MDLTSALPRNLPPILVDEPSLDRVLANLLVNALAATPPGGSVRCRRSRVTSNHHPEVELVVADTGWGLAPEDQQQLFEKYRLRPNHDSNSGLGLYICKTLVEANHGRIWVESAPGQGARFHLVLPVEAGGGAPPGGVGARLIR